MYMYMLYVYIIIEIYRFYFHFFSSFKQKRILDNDLKIEEY